MSLEKIEKLRQEIEKLEEEYERANFGNMFDKSKQDSLYKKLKKNDYVHVCFKRSMTRKEPRYAWTIEVTDKPDDGAVDVD